MRVVVVGAGSIGANITYRLARAGVDVTVVDAGTPAAGTSSTSIAWLSSFPQLGSSTPEMAALRARSMAEYRQLAAELGDGWMHWTGTLTWSEDPLVAERLGLDYLTCRAAGHEVHVWKPSEVAEREPAVAVGTAETVYWESEGGWVDMPPLVSSLLDAAVGAGARVLTGDAVREVQVEHGAVAGVILASGARLGADVAVNAAGSWSSHVSALAGCATPLDLRPGLVVYTPPLATPLQRVVNTTELFARPHPTGGLAAHWRGESTYTKHELNAPGPETVMAALAAVIPELAGVEAASWDIGIRPVPPGGPLVGWHPSLQGFFVCTSAAGVGWGPLWGHLVAEAVTSRQTPEALLPFSPRRFVRGRG